MRAVAALFIVSIIYAIVRYAVFTPENYQNLPVFIVNKGMAMAAALSFAAGFLQQWRRRRGVAITIEPATWFRAGVFGAIAHIPMSLAILRPAYFNEFFIDERLSFTGEMVFLFGGLTAGGLYLLTRPNWNSAMRWVLSLTTLLTLGVHVLTMGICRGFNIKSQYAYLPPMWLLSLIGVVCSLWWLWRSRETKRDATSSQSAPWMQER